MITTLPQLVRRMRLCQSDLAALALLTDYLARLNGNWLGMCCVWTLVAAMVGFAFGRLLW